MSERAAISVVLSVRNAEGTLRESIQSVLNQTRDDFELLAIDDGSTDGSLAILDYAAESDPRVRVIVRSHQGLTSSLIHGTSLARGEYVARQDADDVSEPERFERQTRWLETHRLAAAGTATAIIDAVGAPIGRFPLRFGPAAVRKGLMAVSTAPVHGSLMFRRECLEAVGGYRAAFVTTQDYDLCLRLAERFDIDNVPDVLYRWRLNADSVYGRRRELQLRYGGVARLFATERARTGSDSYALFERSAGDLDAFAATYPLSGRLHAVWGELMLRGLNDSRGAFAHFRRAVARGDVAPRTLALLGWTALGLPWIGGKPLRTAAIRSQP